MQGYNQVAFSDNHIIIGVHVSQDANDFDCWEPTLDAAQTQRAALGKTIGLALADTRVFPRGQSHRHRHRPGQIDCPRQESRGLRRSSSNPADGPAAQGLDPLDAMRHRMRQPENAERYKRRSATVEPVIGHLKDQTRLRRFSRRGLQEPAAAELNLADAALNLTKLHHHIPATA